MQPNKPLEPEIILCPAVLQKHFFENVVYAAAQMGATHICPIITEKTKTQLHGKGRLEKIMIAACEQSKQFILPKLHEPKTLRDFLETAENSKKVFFETNSKPLLELLNDIHQHKPEKIVLMFGPEGGITTQEAELLQQHDFAFYSLTPTILRAVDAVTVGLGSIRSVAG